LWALWFVIAALIALVVVPTYLGQRVEDAETRITDVLIVAGSLSSQMEVLKAQQRSYFEAYALGGDRSNLAAYREGKAQEDSLFAQLNVLSQDLDVDVRRDLADLMAASETWHIQNQLAFLSDSVGNALEVSRRGYETLRSATRQLDEEIQRLVEAGREEMARARALQSRLSLGLGLLALGATLGVGRFGVRGRDLGDEAEWGGDEAEAGRRGRAAVRGGREGGGGGGGRGGGGGGGRGGGGGGGGGPRPPPRPSDADLAGAEAELVIVRRGWVPRAELPRLGGPRPAQPSAPGNPPPSS
jgi:hypothetical protein